MFVMSPPSEVNDVYVFGDSHWRVFFPFVNHGDPGISHTGECNGVKVRTIDTIANELSGSTMWGLLNSGSRHGARNRTLNTLKNLNGVENVALVFGEVDARYHYARYHEGDKLLVSRVIDLVSRYVRFVQEDLIQSGLVRNNVFIYHGFAYPKKEKTLLQPGQPIGKDVNRAENVNNEVNQLLTSCFRAISNVEVITTSLSVESLVSEDGVHLEPSKVYGGITLPAMTNRFLRQRERWAI